MGGGAPSAQEIEVVYEALHDASTRLAAAIVVLDEVTQHNGPLVGLADSAGDPSVVSAITSFLHVWSYGLSCMRADAQALATNLGGSASAYQALEAALTAAASGTRR